MTPGDECMLEAIRKRSIDWDKQDNYLSLTDNNSSSWVLNVEGNLVKLVSLKGKEREKSKWPELSIFLRTV